MFSALFLSPRTLAASQAPCLANSDLAWRAPTDRTWRQPRLFPRCRHLRVLGLLLLLQEQH